MNRSLLNLRVTIPQKYNDRIEFASGVTIFLDTHFNPEEKVALSGVVTYVPANGELAKSGIKKGDTVYFDYRVVSDGDMLPGYGRSHTNEIDINGSKEWFVGSYHLLGVKDGESIKPFGKYVFAKPTVTAAAFVSSIIIAPDCLKDTVNNDKVNVIAVSDKVETVQNSDTVWIRSDLAQKYNFSGVLNDTTLVISADYIIAKD